MSLNIKSPEAHELAADLARLTGESMTKAIRERLERARRQRDRDTIVANAMAIAGQVASYPRKDRRPHGDFLYDDRGLPRR